MSHARIWFGALALIVAPVLLAASGGNLNHPTGTRGVIMVDKVGGYIRFFDPTMDRELASFMASDEVGLRPHELAIAPDGKSAYVSVYGDGVFGRNPHPGHTVVIVDLGSRKIVGSIDVAPYQAPHGIQVDAAGNVYVACDQSHKVLVLDPTTRSVEAAIDVDAMGHWVALAPSASKLYVTNHGDKPFIGVIDLKSRKMIAKVPVATGTMGITASPDGKTVLAADAPGGHLKLPQLGPGQTPPPGSGRTRDDYAA